MSDPDKNRRNPCPGGHVPFTWALLLMLFLAIPLFPGVARTVLAGETSASQLADLLKNASMNRVLSFPDHEGHFRMEAMGDRGSVFRLSIHMTGFYVRPILTLSMSLQNPMMPTSPQYEDVYEILPMSMAVNAVIDNKRHCRNRLGDRLSTFRAHYSKTVKIPEPPATESTGPEIPSWLYSMSSAFHDKVTQVTMRVRSRQANGGDASCSLFFVALMNGIRSSPSGSHETKGRIGFTTRGDGKEDPAVRLTRARWGLADFLPVKKPFNLEDLSLAFSGTTEVTVGCSGEETVSDTTYRITYEFNMAPKMNVSAVLKPVEKDEERWEPLPDQTRRYTLELEDPGPERVEAVRFALEEVSSHPGKATNAGIHLGSKGVCGHCGKKNEAETWPWEVFFPNEDGSTYSLMRRYTHYDACVLDSLPDMFFTDKDNPGFDLGETLSERKLAYGASLSLQKEGVKDKNHTVTVQVMDGAPRGLLRAWVRVAGLWYPARAEGPTSTEDKTSLMLPLDADRDGLADVWEKKWSVDSPGDDKDNLMGNPNAGDGVSVFEEYRGIYSLGRHHRLSPVYVDVFVHDYAGHYNEPLRIAGTRFREQEIMLWRLAGDEFKYDVVNYQDTENKNGDQYIVVAMSQAQCPGLDTGWARGVTTLGPPSREYNSMIIVDYARSPLELVLGLDDPLGDQTENVAGVIGHELGHMMSLTHHGEQEGFRMVEGKSAWVACLGGQHSGYLDCFMKYKNASYYMEQDFVPRSGIILRLQGGKLHPYPDGERGGRVKFCTSPAGRGVCGDAQTGGCLGRLKVKSY